MRFRWQYPLAPFRRPSVGEKASALGEWSVDFSGPAVVISGLAHRRRHGCNAGMKRSALFDSGAGRAFRSARELPRVG
jgi:hypothetical protein